MTAIVGLVHDGSVFIGADSAGVDNWKLVSRADQKVFQKGEFIFGFTTSFRMGQLLRYSLELPRYVEPRDIMDYMVLDFIREVRACMLLGGYLRKKDERERGGQFLVGFHGRLFNIDYDFHVGESHDNFDAVGCGSELCLGSLFTSSGNPIPRIRKALQAAERYSTGVCGPFNIVVTPDVRKES